MRLTSLFALSLVSAFTVASAASAQKATLVACCSARCTGSAYCSACTNCSRCAHCNAGGSCGVCAGTSSGRGSSDYSYSSDSSTSSYTALPPAPKPRPKPKPTPEPKLPSAFVARVIGVTDGDTVTVLTGSNRRVKVRLHGIDAPEKKQDYYQQSKQTLANLCYDQTVNLTVRDTDKYGRTVATLTLGGKNLNHEQIKRGMAWWYEKYAPEDIKAQNYQEHAKFIKLGIWSKPSPTAPWVFRRKKGQG